MSADKEKSIPTRLLSFKTKDGITLQGHIMGPERPKNVIIALHGLGGSMFSRIDIFRRLVSKDTGVLMFNNRGYGVVSSFKRVSGERVQAGSAHEVFSDCVFDIDAAVALVRRMGAQSVYLAGHSTGCQKIVYWLAAQKGKRAERLVRGAILLAPMSDYAGALHLTDAHVIAKATAFAKKMVANNTWHELLPQRVWENGLCDAQRFLSLYTPDSEEELFSYSQPARTPRALLSVRTPLHIILAKNDEYADRPAKDIAAWFECSVTAPHTIDIVSGADHSFKNREQKVADAIELFLRRW